MEMVVRNFHVSNLQINVIFKDSEKKRSKSRELRHFQLRATPMKDKHRQTLHDENVPAGLIENVSSPKLM